MTIGIALSEASARTRLESMLAWESDPPLSSAQVTELLAMCKVADLYDLGPNDGGYTPTWYLPVGAAEGWRWKAAAAASRFDFNTDVSGFKRDQLIQHCLAMVEQYSSFTGTIELSSSDGAGYDPVIGNLNGGN